MADHTYVSITVNNEDDRLEALGLMWSLVTDRPFGPMQVWRGDGPPSPPTTLVVSLPGNVEDELRRRLAESTLQFRIEVKSDGED